MNEQIMPTLKDLSAQIKTLPLLPTVVTQVMALNEKDSDFYESLLKIVKTDPPMCATLLRLANSAAYSIGSNVKTIESAMMRIGTQAFMESISSAGVARVFIPKSAHQKGLWRHSIRTALIASMLAKKASVLHINANQAYMVGLMHDIGSFVLLDLLPGSIDKIEDKGWEINNEKVDVERSMIGYDHSEIGYLVCQHWGFHDEIAEIIRDHHKENIWENSEIPLSKRRMMMIVQFSDYFASLMENISEWQEMDINELAFKVEAECKYPIWSMLKVVPVDIVEWIKTLDEEITSVSNIMGVNS